MDEVACAFPGDSIGSAKAFAAGMGAYTFSGEVRASLTGSLHVQSEAIRPMVMVKPNHTPASSYVIREGHNVLCKVTKVNYNQAFVDIMMLEEVLLPFPAKAVIRREDIRDKEIDKVVVHDFFKPQDFVKAVVISMGDNKSYFLSIARPGLGVIVPNKVDDTAMAI